MNYNRYQELYIWYSMKYDDHYAYIKVFDKIFGDRDSLWPGEFEQSEEYFNKLYKKETRKRKILKILGIL